MICLTDAVLRLLRHDGPVEGSYISLLSAVTKQVSFSSLTVVHHFLTARRVAS